MTGLPPFSTTRLPSYRTTHLGRFHPYPMASRRCNEDYLMITVNRRGALGGLEPIIEEPEAVSLARPLAAYGGLLDCDFPPCDVDHPVDDDDHVCQCEHARDEPMQPSGHRKLAVAFVNMMFALRRKYLALLAGTNPTAKETETK